LMNRMGISHYLYCNKLHTTALTRALVTIALFVLTSF
jgi:hypothetical protein